MDKQTKILIGIGAAIAAYLILKPKKAVVQNIKVPSTPQGVKGESVLSKEWTEYFKNRISPTNGVCPQGYVKEEIFCITTPCPEGKCRLATREELGIPPDYVDNSEECKKNPYACKI